LLQGAFLFVFTSFNEALIIFVVVLQMFDQLTSGPQVVVGSSMGVWLLLKLAMMRKERVRGLVGIGSAPDFTERRLNSFTAQQKSELMRNGVVYVPSAHSDQPYPYSLQMLVDGKDHLLFHEVIVFFFFFFFLFLFLKLSLSLSLFSHASFCH
jgi:pimeloyl-ACP methyl ester carboxylesterase